MMLTPGEYENHLHIRHGECPDTNVTFVGCKVLIDHDEEQRKVIADLLAALQDLVDLRAETELTHEAAYRVMFKSEGIDSWFAAQAAIAKAMP